MTHRDASHFPGSVTAPDPAFAGDRRHLEVCRHGRVAVVRIDRPPVNALTFDAYDALHWTFVALGDDAGVSVVVLTGAGSRAFVAGHDVNEFVTMTPHGADADLARVRLAFDAVQDCPVPVIAAVNGAAVGAGLALASLCDVRLASTEAVFALPEIDVGVLGSASHLMRLVPQGVARLLALTGRRMPAGEALRVGLVDELHEPEELGDAALALAREMAAKSPMALRLMKEGLNRVEDLSVKAGYAYECRLTSAVRRGTDAAEGARSYVEKRVPRYAGLENEENA